jgi:hypothetical protein
MEEFKRGGVLHLDSWILVWQKSEFSTVNSGGELFFRERSGGFIETSAPVGEGMGVF